MRACKCPNCGANLKVTDDDREFMYCEYCGARIDLADRRTVHTEHIIDDAKIKNAENVSRIVNIFAAPVEERQRQKEFERQRQAEAERREYERQKQKEADRRANAEAIEDGCAAVAGGCLVKCAKHPVIACIIIFLLFGSCMGSGSSSSSASSAASSSESASIASVSQSTGSAVPSTSSSAKETGIIVHSLNELPGTSKSTIRSFSYQFAFAHSGNANSMHYWLIDPTNLVVCLLNTYEQSAYLFTLPSVRFTTGVTLDYGAASYTLQTTQLNSVLSVTYGSDGPYDFSAVSVQDALSVLSMDIHGCYDLRSVTSLEVPLSGDVPSAISDTAVSPASLPASSTASNSSNSTSIYSEPEPSLNYTPSHSETNYDVAYGQRFSEYTNYCLISYQDKIVRFFSYGNGSKEAYVGHITGGSKSSGLTVHYNYDNGWDETIKIVGSQMILTDANGYHYAFDLAPLSPVRDIYKDNHYHDITEN